MKVKQGTTVYHRLLGKGMVIGVQYRRDNSLYMCYFPQSKGHEFITHKQLVAGDYDITLKKPLRSNKGKGDSLEDILGGLLRGS